MHYISHVSSHVRHFGSIAMYSTEIGELVHKEQIEEGYRMSNKNEAARQILSQYGRQHALGMRLQTLDVLLKAENVIMIEGIRRGTATLSNSTPQRMLKGRMKNVSMLTALSRICNIDYGDIMEEMLHF